ncbi:hypothetical protein BUALT_Bualt16G0001800 [Buddleja alternifolia]|uniref:Uncharacterized protein n=1 Tax=Buddleja alternifolia TaxID=168488 RepID=A0AAV6WFJ5_9LAMI|nr:hypothetical protein BUALT_Bualt16G0001800 [Buddleja alternifolia]
MDPDWGPKDPDWGLKDPDWGPVVVAVGLFILLSPGLLCQFPARTRMIEFGNMYTSAISILLHAVLYFFQVPVFHKQKLNLDAKAKVNKLSQAKFKLE